VSKVVLEKLSEYGMSREVEKGVLEVGFSADFVESLQSFIKDNTKLTEEAFTDDNSQILKKFGQRISGITRPQLEVLMVLLIGSNFPDTLFCSFWTFSSKNIHLFPIGIIILPLIYVLFFIICACIYLHRPLIFRFF